MKSDCFKQELSLISDTKIRAFIKEYLDKFVPDYFYVVPASSSGKYHPQYALGEGGLVRHTKACVVIANELLELTQFKYIDHDNAISALIIHDTFKQGLDKGHTKFEHPLLASSAIILFAKEYHPEMLGVAREISKLVATHMEQWNTNSKSKVVLPLPETAEQKFVHMCDYLASRKNITVDVSYGAQKEE